MLFVCYVACVLQENTSAHTKSRKQVQSAPPAPVLQPGRTGVDLLDNPVIGVIKSLNRYTVHLIPQSDTAGTELLVMCVLMADDGLGPFLVLLSNNFNTSGSVRSRMLQQNPMREEQQLLVKTAPVTCF